MKRSRMCSILQKKNNMTKEIKKKSKAKDRVDEYIYEQSSNP